MVLATQVMQEQDCDKLSGDLRAFAETSTPLRDALFAWGNRHFAPEGASVVLVNRKTQAAADPLLIDRRSGRPLDESGFTFVAGPAASERTRRRYAIIQQQQFVAQQSSRPARGRKRRKS